MFVLTASGLTLFVTPPGRVANWSNWTFLSLTKSQWQSVHTIIAFLFVAAAAFHLFFNWKVITSYLRTRLEEGMRRKRELALAGVVVIILLTITIADAPPASLVMDFGSDLKNSWVTRDEEPPLPHAELLTLGECAERLSIPTADLRSRLRLEGIDVDTPSATLGEIADRNGLTPLELYGKMERNATRSTTRPAPGSGYGRRTVAQIAEQLAIPVDTALGRLNRHGISAGAQSMLRDIASTYGLTPSEIADHIHGGAQR
jgi:hypothetical protein